MKTGFWTPEEDQAVIEGVAANQTSWMIAVGLNRTLRSVKRRREELANKGLIRKRERAAPIPGRGGRAKPAADPGVSASGTVISPWLVEGSTRWRTVRAA